MSREWLIFGSSAFDSSAEAPIEIFTIDDMDEPTKKHYYRMMTRLLNQTFKVDGVKVLYHESDIDKLKIKISVEGLYDEI